ncbi:hypothetical protein [Streptacidiphilus jiangxiensis]|uniref:Uncharacterized protein n=1 Tax=Streptacidiphilus jiangxiensis TaxID=235985 RepID=A0A1H8B7Y7_STRJI|nr:hypothetical protein [Streptacidiphilus jiangxiensis]SEM78007.1 hypothetical protein SAMN05414137_15721 [Streptacidiphilus jiangxiensis]
MAAEASLVTASISRVLALAGFPRHAPHQPIGFHVEAPTAEQPEGALARVRWHGEDDGVQSDRLDVMRAYLIWDGRPARAARDDRGPMVLVIAHHHATDEDLARFRPSITPTADRYETVIGERRMHSGLSPEAVTRLVQGSPSHTFAYQLPSGEIRIGNTRLVPESDANG